MWSSRLTLIVVILVRSIAIKLAQKFDHIRVRIGAGECVASAIKAQNQLLGRLARGSLLLLRSLLPIMSVGDGCGHDDEIRFKS